MAPLNEQKAHLTFRTLLDNAAEVLGRNHYQDRSIKIQKSQVMPGVKTMRIDGEAHGTDLYQLTLIFYGVSYSKARDSKHQIPVEIDGEQWFAEKPDVNVNPVRVWCSCTWFRFAAEWYLEKNKALAPRRKPRSYTKVPGSNRPPINPKQLPCVCKHQYQFALELQKRGVIQNLPVYNPPSKKK